MKNYQKTHNLALNFQPEIKPIIKDNSYFLLKYNLKNKEKGSLLIRIFFYLIISGFLVAIAFPNLFLVQGSKCGNLEIAIGKNFIGTLNRSQQAYHFEKHKFTSNIQDLGVTLPESKYYNFLVEVNPSIAYALSIPQNYQKDGVRSYSSAIFFDNKTNSYQQIRCQTDGKIEQPTKPIFTKGILTCPENMIEIK